MPDSIFDGLTEGPTTVAAIVEVSSKVEHEFAALSKSLEIRSADITKATETHREFWNEKTHLPRGQRLKMADEEIKADRRKILENSIDERWTRIKQMQALASQVEATASLFESPAIMLSRFGVGSPERLACQQNLSHAGPAEIRAQAQYAVATGNKMLAAAIMTRLDAMSKSDRQASGITRQALAQAVMGEDHARAQESIKITRNRLQAGINSNREFESGRKNAHACISDALARREESGVLQVQEDSP